MNHNALLNEFMKQCKDNDPQHYKEVCAKYPVLSSRQWQRIHEQEEPLEHHVAVKYGIESSYENEE